MRLAESTPILCSSCYGQYPDRRHVDFEAAWDGPVVGSEFKMSVDDLILCEDCVRQAAKLIGLVEPEGTEAKYRAAKQELEIAKEGWAEAEQRLKKIEGVLA